TSCDETAAAVVEDGRRIISDVVSSQIDIHARYGGVVPEVASRQHLLTIIPVVSQAMTKVSWQEINGIAVTFGPGLAGSLLVGVNVAKAIALAKKLPVSIRLETCSKALSYAYVSILIEKERLGKQ
ncbi:unnamed protein product, partial [marine sediment metagenome]